MVYTAGMQITVFGASGKVGSLVVEEALRRGYTVVAFVHSHDLFSPSGKLIMQKGDVYKPDDVARALRGSDAVVSCLSSWGASKRTVLGRAMQNILPAMVEQRITRLVSLTGIGIREKRGVLYRLALSLLSPLPVGQVFRDAERHVALLRASNRDWTVVCSPVMNNLGSSDYRLSLHMGSPLTTVSRGGVAAALLDQIDATDYLRQTPTIHRK